MDVINAFTAPNPGRIDVAEGLGSVETAMYIYDVDPGEGASPYHYEYAEEWLLVLDGSVVVRTPEGELELERGGLVCFPAGPAGAHKVMNRSDSRARTLLFSSSRLPAVSVYPDSEKVGVWLDDGPDDLIFRRETAVAWADGEDDWNKAV